MDNPTQRAEPNEGLSAKFEHRATFTPGPWTIWEPHRHRGFHAAGATYSIRVPKVRDGKWNGYVAGILAHAPNAEANARLIGASPDLLRELSNMVEIYWGLHDDKNGDGGEPPACIVSARAAIAKATGAQP